MNSRERMIAHAAWVAASSQAGAIRSQDDAVIASAAFDAWAEDVATTPPAVSEPFEKIEQLPAVLPEQNSATQTEQDTEATVWVDGETMAALRRAIRLVGSTDYDTINRILTRCRVTPEVANG
jgi:hypothetical protein